MWFACRFHEHRRDGWKGIRCREVECEVAGCSNKTGCTSYISILNRVSRTPCKVYIDTGGEEKPGPTAEQTKLRVPRRPNWIGLSPEQLKEVKVAPYSAKSTVVDFSGGKSEFLGLEERAGSAPRGNWGCGDSLREELGVLEAIVESDRA